MTWAVVDLNYTLLMNFSVIVCKMLGFCSKTDGLPGDNPFNTMPVDIIYNLSFYNFRDFNLPPPPRRLDRMHIVCYLYCILFSYSSSFVSYLLQHGRGHSTSLIQTTEKYFLSDFQYLHDFLSEITFTPLPTKVSSETGELVFICLWWCSTTRLKLALD